MGYTIMLWAGIVLAVISLLIFKRSVSFITANERVTATVTSMESVRDSDGTTYRPVFTFSTADNTTVNYHHFASSSPPAWVIGEQASLVYSPAEPANATLLTYFGAFGWSIILMAIAAPCLVIGGGYFLTRGLLQ